MKAQLETDGRAQFRPTLLIGGLPRLHLRLIAATLESEKFACQQLSTPSLQDCQTGRENAPAGLCNPAYFTAGNLIRHLRALESSGLSRQQIAANYAFLTAGSCGPCRFGLYEHIYREALESAGFGGFRILLIHQQDGLRAGEGKTELCFSPAFLPKLLRAILLADILNETQHRLRPYAMDRAAAEAGFESSVDLLCDELRQSTAPPRTLPAQVARLFFGRSMRRTLAEIKARLDAIELDRLRLRPVVKITGEFWAQSTEGEGNYKLFDFLEREGAEVLVDPLSSWLLYLLEQARHGGGERWRLRRTLAGKAAGWLAWQRRNLPMLAGARLYEFLYREMARRMGCPVLPLAPQKELVTLAAPHFDRRARGGEGHLEIGKALYYTEHHLAQMILSLKPFGCMPSTQSDGVLAPLASRHATMIFQPIETAPEGSVHALSRVQMSLGEARRAARVEMETVLRATGRSLEELRHLCVAHPELLRRNASLPQPVGCASTAARQVLQLDALLRQGMAPLPASARNSQRRAAGRRIAQAQD